MKKEIENKEPVQQQEQASRGWRDVLSARNSELNLDDDAAVGSYLDQSFQDFDRAEQERRSFNDVLSSDPNAAGILTGLASGMGEDGEAFSLSGYLFDKYEDELRAYFEGEMTKEEALARIKEKESAQIKAAAEAEARRKTASENLAKADEALTKAVSETNIDEANVQSMLQWLYGTDEADGYIHRIIRHELDVEDWKRLIHAFNLDAELENARKEGRTAMRKERGQAHRNAAEAPTYTGGGGSSETAPRGSGNPTADRYSGMKRRYT